MICINEHKVGREGRVTYRQTWQWLTDDTHMETQPLAPDLRREAYSTWEQSADLREATGSKTAMHPLDWVRRSTAHEPRHPSIDDVLASRGYEDDGSIRS